AGDDTCLLKTCLVLRENPNRPDAITNLTRLFGGSGSNRYEYLQNAPVEINGGSGFDTIVIDGTPLADTFVITSTYVAGAGRIVNFRNIESIEVDGGGGGDSFWILNTDPGLKVTVNGGSRAAPTHIGRPPPPPPSPSPPRPFRSPPPPYPIQLPPKVLYPDVPIDLSGFTFTVNIIDWLAHGGSLFLGDTAATTAAAGAYVNAYVSAIAAIFSLIPLSH